MRFCRFGDNRLGLVEGPNVRDVSAALDVLPAYRHPLPKHDVLVANLDRVAERAKAIAPQSPSLKERCDRAACASCWLRSGKPCRSMDDRCRLKIFVRPCSRSFPREIDDAATAGSSRSGGQNSARPRGSGAGPDREQSRSSRSAPCNSRRRPHLPPS